MRKIIIIFTLVLSSSLFAQVPHTFTSGEKIEASKINENFEKANTKEVAILKEVYVEDALPVTCPTAGSWKARVMNTLEGNANFITLVDPSVGTGGTNNKILLQPGKYLVNWSAPHTACEGMQTTMNIVNPGQANDGQVVGTGNSGHNTATLTTSLSIGRAYLDISVPTTYEIRHYTQSNSKTYSYLGYRSDGINLGFEVHFTMDIQKLD